MCESICKLKINFDHFLGREMEVSSDDGEDFVGFDKGIKWIALNN